MSALNAKLGANVARYPADFLLQSLLKNIPDSIFFKDLESRFILVNHAAARLFKLKSPEEAVGKTDFDIFTEEHARAAFADEQEIIRTGNPLVGKEERETWPDGTVSWVTTTKLPLRNRQGDIIGTFGISRNITERILAVEQISEQAALIDIAPDAILVCDLQSTILFWNKGAEHVYGWSRQEVLGQTISDLLYPKVNRAKHDEIFRAVLNHGKWTGEVHHIAKNKRKLIVESQLILVRNTEDRPKSILVINTDITEKKKIEAHFMRAQRMESLGTLAGGIAHDLNNILAPILISIDLLKLSIKGPETKIINAIETSAHRGAAVVKQVLSFARGMEGDRAEVSLQHLLKEVEQIIKNTFPKNIQLDISTPSDLWTIMGDPTQLHQMLLNLCVNARDAMPGGGRLTITAENRRFDEQDMLMNRQAMAGPYVMLSVTDAGMGIEPDILDKIFEPFFTTKEFGKGTGLGLSTAMAIVKSHGGLINVYSEVGKGSVFKVHLPAEACGEAAHRKTQPVGLPRGNGETILVVDDESPVLGITSDMLLAFGYRVLTATNGVEAITIYTQHQNEIAAILTDMSMPVMDGLSTIHALKKINPDAKIIAASGLHTDESMAKAARAGIKYFLNKPSTTGTLLNILREILDHPLATETGV